MGLLEDIGIRLIWFDSLGAKASCITIESDKGLIVVDPGAAEMQPGYPLPRDRKLELRREALRKMAEVCRKASVIVITHYHFDHYVLPDDKDLPISPREYYMGGKLILVKNPNMYINESQWGRARVFLRQLLELDGRRLGEFQGPPCQVEFEDPVEKLVKAHSRNYGDYAARRAELLKQGKEWFKRLCRVWSTRPWIKDEIRLSDGTIIKWCDKSRLEFGNVELIFYEPWFHGMEYERTGWIIPLLIIKGSWRIFYTSDVMGPIIEDYVDEIVRARPDVVILDGPATYLFPYMINKTNLDRAIKNAIELIITTRPRLVIYDHHLTRDPKWRTWVRDVYQEASRAGVEVKTAAEYLGWSPVSHIIFSS